MRGSRRGRIAVYLVCALSGVGGSGWWCSRIRFDGSILNKTPSELPRFVAIGGIIGLAGWGVLLIVGEATLFVLAVMNVGDREVHDRYRNLMILWGYVLTLGTSRFFRGLPAQFAQLFADEDAAPARRRERRGRHGSGCHDE